MSARCLLAIGFSVLALGCGDGIVSDIVSVPARPPEPTPVTAFRSTLGESAFSLLFVGDLIESDGTVDAVFTDGSSVEGHVDIDTGEFDLLYQLPNGYFTVSVHDVGRFELDGSYILGADYRENYTYANATEARWDMSLDVDYPAMELDAEDLDRGTRVKCSTRILEGRVNFSETWDLENGYHEDITTVYRDVDPYVSQDWVRDEFATAVKPDRSGSLEFAQDGSGTGRLDWFYDHDITSVYEIVQDASGNATATLVYEDPATTVSPDGEGTYSFAANNSGSGVYTERYDDGSVLVSNDDYGVDGSTDETFTFNDAATIWAVDVDGSSFTEGDGSGTGAWSRYDGDGVTETCEYAFDTTGAIDQIDCS